MKKISVRLPEDLLEEVDTFAQLEGTDRTALLKRALLEYLERERREEGLKERAVRLYLSDRLTDAKLEMLLGPEDAEAVRTAKRLLEEGERLAQKLT